MADRELASAKLRQDAIRQFATRDINAANYLLQHELTDVTSERVNAVLTKLRKHVDQLAPLDQKVCDAASDEDIADEQAKVIEIELKLGDAITELEVRLNELKPSPAQTSQGSLDTSTVATATMKHRMPELELTKFSGDPLRWSEFWDDFSCSVDERTNISVIDKFKLLKQCLQGDAASLADGYYLTVANYSHVKDELKSRFGDPEVAIGAHLEALLELKPATLETSQLVAVRDKCEAHVRSLIALGLDENSFGRIYAPIILSKLPKLVKMYMNRRNGSKAWTLAALREALREEIQIRTKSEQHKRTDGSDEGKWKSKTEPIWKKQHASVSALLTSSHGPQHAKASPSAKPRACMFCSSPDHRNWECQLYPDVQSRLAQVRGRCTACFSAAHQHSECRSTGSCFYCHCKEHNSSLCPTEFAPDSPGQQHAESDQMSTANATLVQANLVRDPVVSRIPPANVNTAHGHKVPGGGPTTKTPVGTAVLETARILVIGKTGRYMARAVFDTGSTLSFITSKLARRIGANPVGYECRALGKFGDAHRSDMRYSTLEFSVHLKDNSEVTLEASAVENVTTPLTLAPLDIQECLQYYDRSDLAEILVEQPTEVEVDILIGLDYYYHFVGDRQWRLKNGLVLKETTVGYIVTGFMKNSVVTKQTQDHHHQLLVVSTAPRQSCVQSSRKVVCHHEFEFSGSKYPRAIAEHAASPRCLYIGSKGNRKSNKAASSAQNTDNVLVVPSSRSCGGHATLLPGSRSLTYLSGGNAKYDLASKAVESMRVNVPRLTPCVRTCSIKSIRSRTFVNSTFRRRSINVPAHEGSEARFVCKVDESTGAVNGPLLSPSELARDRKAIHIRRLPLPDGRIPAWATSQPSTIKNSLRKYNF